MVVLGICLFVVLALGQLAIFVRLSPLQVLVDERTARQRAQERKGDADATEGTALLRGLRTLHKEQAEIVRRERATSDDLRAQLNAERIALQARCKELNAERLALVNTLYSEFAPERVERAAWELKTSREQRAALARGERAQGENPAALGHEEETKREGTSKLAAMPEGQRAQGVKDAALAEGEQTEGERPTALPTTPGDVADDSELVAATAAGDADADADDAAETRVLLKAEMQAALGAEAGGAPRPPRASPRAALSAPVAPPASAPPLPSAETAIPAAGLERRLQSGPVAPPPAPLPRTKTLLGMPAVPPHEPVGDASARPSWPTLNQGGGVGHSTPTPAGSAPRDAVPYVAKTLLSMPAQGATATSSPSVSAASPPRPEDTRPTFESFPLFDPEHSNAPRDKQEAAE